MALTTENFLNIAMKNTINAEIAFRLPQLGLDQCMLTAGCLFQTIWNHQSQLPLTWGIKDYDVFYFDEDQKQFLFYKNFDESSDEFVLLVDLKIALFEVAA